MHNIYEQGLEMTPANYVPLSPLSFMERTAAIWPDRLAVVHGDVRRTWAETYARTCKLAGALTARGIGKGDTVSIIAANIPEMFEAHYGVPMAGAVLNTINTRLDAEAIAFILNHGEAKAVIVDPGVFRSGPARDPHRRTETHRHRYRGRQASRVARKSARSPTTTSSRNAPRTTNGNSLPTSGMRSA